uniref:YLP motif-containing protein 1 isoform X2 n=1 Tax=Rhizophora mucronata TaxID=61149 RepID=A0A2P2LGP9_RHIMU
MGPGAHPGRVLCDDERRLKLIRDHGGAGGLGNAEMNGPRNDGSDMYCPFQPDGSYQPTARDESYSHSVNYPNSQQNPYGMSQYMRPRPDYRASESFVDPREVTETNRGPNMHRVGQYGALNSNEERVFMGHLPPPPPPLPVSPPPPPPPPPLEHPQSEFSAYSSPPKSSFSLFPVPISSTENNPYLHNKSLSHVSTSLLSEEQKMSLRQYPGEDQSFLPKQLSPDKPSVVDASCLFKKPHRANRPDHIVIILRGLPGSGKSYLAKIMRDLEVESGRNAPRIHSMDDYFMTEVEKVEEGDVSKSLGLVRGKKPMVKKVMEYFYEPEMEEVYRDSMLKAFKKTLEEGIFTFVIVDDRNLRVADFAQFWAIAKVYYLSLFFRTSTTICVPFSNFLGLC